MRNAERFLAQGKIQAAISEYRQIVEHDKKDFNTLNLLGDLYVKSDETEKAVECFTTVAEHYSKQGFAQKAIAIYQKIARLKPNEPQVAENLAQLYHSRGSIVEARDHYTQVAGFYEQNGNKLEALNIWKQIASIDPNNTEIYLKIAAAYTAENQFESATESYIGAGERFAERGQDERAIVAYKKALEIDPDNIAALKGLVNAQIKLGFADEAIINLEELLEKQPDNRELIFLLTDCYLDLGETEKAEKLVLEIIEKEPANYPKLLDILKIYLKNGDVDAAVRILSLTVENLLASGQGKDFYGWLDEILARSPENLAALRLLARYYGWQRNETEIKNALERLAEAAHHINNFEEERYALMQLITIAPQDSEYARRLQEIKVEHGLMPETASAFSGNGNDSASPEPENFNGFSDNASSQKTSASFEAFENFYAADSPADEIFSAEITENGNDFSNDLSYEPTAAPISDYEIIADTGGLKPADEMRLAQELESAEFYLTQGYRDLAEKSLDDLESEFGAQAEIVRLRARFSNPDTTTAPLNIGEGEIFSVESSVLENAVVEVPAVETQPTESGVIAPKEDLSGYDDFSDFRADLGLEESEEGAAGDDYETHYQFAVAYQEMGLTEDAIREYQEAIGLVSANDGTRRFFQCSNLLGHCFMEKQMPNLALIWFKRAMETRNLNEAERHGMLYELGNASEIGGDYEKAAEYFEQIYAVDVDYRNVAKRLESLREHDFLQD